MTNLSFFSFFVKSNEFSKLVAEEYLKFFDFTGMTLDFSLRYMSLCKPDALMTVLCAVLS